MSHASPSESRPWLTLVGVGEDGIEGLGRAARAALTSAEAVFGSARQLALVSSLTSGQLHAWPSPFADGVAQVLARRGRPTCVLASGDPFWYGVGATLAPRLSAGEYVCYPAPSSASLAAARLGWPLQDVELVSLHGRDLALIVPHLSPGRRVLALSWDRATPAALARLLAARGFGPTTLHVLERLGGPDERVQRVRAQDFALADLDDLNLVGLEVCAEPSALVIPRRGSLPDGAFEHDGQLTKRDVRALTLSALAPRPGELLWDLGAGSGSIAIEWMLAHPACRAVAVEQDPVRCERIARNARALGVPGLGVVHAVAPEGLSDLPRPDAIFVGGGGSDAALVERAMSALGPSGRLVMNAVAIETEAALMGHYLAHGGELRRFSIEVAAPLGTMHGFRPAMAVTQWTWVRR